MNLINNFRYRPEIDGLRALAVIAVILFHADYGASGGFIGVDVFFVISGFLITSLIWKDLETNRFAFTKFWERRARRIIPALVAVIIATLIAGWFLLLPMDLKELGRAAYYQVFFASNFYYWQHTGYFMKAAKELPLLHTWSLAIEEQFYLITPFLLWGMFRFRFLRRRTTIIPLLAAGSAASFAISVYFVAHRPATAFYLLPTRAWELLIGSLVAFLPAISLFQCHRWLREPLCAVGLALVFIPVFTYTHSTPFPGAAALLPCLGTAMVIWANGGTSSGVPTSIGKALATPPLVFIGLISYSLYLWHLPFLAFSNYLSIFPLPFAYSFFLLMVASVCAVLSWKFVETPFRTRKLGVSMRSMYFFAGAGLAVVLALGLTFRIMHRFPHHISDYQMQFAKARSDMAYTKSLNTKDIYAKRLIRIGVKNPALHPSLLVWGDSHAMAAQPALDAFLKEKGLSGLVATAAATAPVLNWFKVEPFGLNDNAIAFNNAVISYIKNQQIRDVILIAFWDSYIDRDRDNSVSIDAALLSTVRQLVAIGCKPWILLDVPKQPFDVPAALSRHSFSESYLASICAKPKPHSSLEKLDPNIKMEIEAAGGHALDPKPMFLDPTGRYYMVHINEIALYRDKHHLTAKGAILKLLPFFRTSLLITAARLGS